MSMQTRLAGVSLRRLQGVHPELVKVVHAASLLSPMPFLVVEGVRTEARQRELYAQGRTAPGRIVTWTMKSKHIPGADGLGHAVDLCPIGAGGKPDWNNTNGFLEIGKAMMNSAMRLGVQLRWGWDWDGDRKLREKGETDGPHFELAAS